MSINLKKRIYTSIILFLIIYLIISFNFFLLFILIVLGNLSILEFFNISKRMIKNKFNLFFINTIFSLYIFLFCILFFYFWLWYTSYAIPSQLGLIISPKVKFIFLQTLRETVTIQLILVKTICNTPCLN